MWSSTTSSVWVDDQACVISHFSVLFKCVYVVFFCIKLQVLFWSFLSVYRNHLLTNYYVSLPASPGSHCDWGWENLRGGADLFYRRVIGQWPCDLDPHFHLWGQQCSHCMCIREWPADNRSGSGQREFKFLFRLGKGQWLTYWWKRKALILITLHAKYDKCNIFITCNTITNYFNCTNYDADLVHFHILYCISWFLKTLLIL